jgi:hypothetical protein
MSTTTMIVSILGPLVGCVIGNFAYRAAVDRDWAKAAEWSVAQAALAAGFVLTHVVENFLQG